MTKTGCIPFLPNPTAHDRRSNTGAWLSQKNRQVRQILIDGSKRTMTHIKIIR